MHKTRRTTSQFQYISILFFLLFTIASCSPSEEVAYKTESLELIKLTESTFIHKSYLQTESFGKVSCNGLVYIENNEAVVVDTPADIQSTNELIAWLENEWGCQIIAVIPTHFHEDCLTGLDQFHEKNIMSYGNSHTIELCIDSNKSFPKVGFDENFELPIGTSKIQLMHPGEGHTSDNIVCYIPNEKVLFGGCLLKAVGAQKGYIDDGNIKEWSQTVKNVKNRFSEAEYIVPGHGSSGNSEILDYTIQLFQ